ncbi:tyrosine-protein phosphatase [Prauserella flavalba]|uniref:Protein tyrosine phosphatase n=1 Tax=Prauserella flavalba TaxID=1477506 RepID=A0A318LN22_9PSEU|nr:tyrosine-protein phosphatase [Prauserella flavalba]PXY30761.1 protein tyrosine phosphatase [Prauserella flavalba]
MLWLELEGAVNIRDVGGIPTEDGGTTARNRLLRADNLQDLSRSDLDYLVDTIGLSTVVDLRTASEIESEGPAPLTKYAHVAHVHHSLLPEQSWGDNSPDALLTRRQEDEARYAGDRTCSHYLGYVEKRPDSIVGALRAILRSEGPALVHCAAGKDRTGVVTAFALSVAGARRDAIVADYAATAERIEAIVRRLTASETYAEDVLRVSLDRHTPKPESMAEFLEQVDVRYGGVTEVLAANGFTTEETSALRTKLRS